MAAARSRDLSRNRKNDSPTRLRGPGLQEAAAGNRGETRKSRSLSFIKPGDCLWHTFDYRKVFPESSGPWLSVLKQPNRSMRGRNSLTPADREMIATYVSSQNDCYFCQTAHGAVAAYRLGGNEKLINDVKLNFESAAISDKLR